MDSRSGHPAVSLVACPDFRLGALTVMPSTRQVEHPGGALTLEPRVMQVLVALHQQQGRVVSRDMLVARCWDGRIVGDNAISRAILRLRHLAEAEGAGSFVIETISRVGYRLVETGPRAPHPLAEEVDPGPARGPDRRGLLAAGAAALAVAGVAYLAATRPTGADRRAEALVAEAEHIAESGLPGARDNAVRLLEEAVALEPGSAKAWGALALAYVEGMDWSVASEAKGSAERARAAADRALALDPRNADAAVARVVSQGWWQRWAAHEAGLGAVLAEHPDHPPTREALARLLAEVGRWRDALALIDPLMALKPLVPRLHLRQAEALAGLGRLPEADATLSRAADRWPASASLWTALFEHRLLSGRPAEARAMVTEEARFRFPHPAFPMDVGLAVATALETGRPAERAAAIAQVMAAREEGVMFSLSAVPALAALGDLDAAFAVLDLYLFGGTTPGGRLLPPPSKFTMRSTLRLFLPPTSAMRDDPRFAVRMERIGLAAYWRETGTAPQLGA